MTPREKVVFRGEFDPKWKTYQLLRILLMLVATIIGIVVAPFWLLGWGQWYCRRYFQSLECLLCERSLVIRRGIFFRTERTIPLDKIQDLTLVEGPLLEAFGLCRLKVETASQKSPEGGSEADLVGIVEARELRDRVLDQRDAVTGVGAGGVAVASSASGPASKESLLVDIRESLGRIEGLLADGRERSER